MSRPRLTRTAHTRRAFLAGAAAIAAGGVGAVALRDAYAGQTGKVLADLDVLEVRLTDYAGKVTKFTTPWGQQADDWLPAFKAAHQALAPYGGGRLIVPAGYYPVSVCALMDLPSVSVHLQAGSEIVKVGTPDEYLGTPLGFYGGLSDGEPRRQQNFAAVVGPGRIGYPQAHLDIYNREVGIGFSYIKTAVVDGVTIPYAPRMSITAQYGCNQVTVHNCTLGYSGQPADEPPRGGQAAIEISGGYLNNSGGTNNGVPYPPRTTTVTIANNRFLGGARGIYLEWCGGVSVTGNDIGPMGRAGIVVAESAGADVRDNLLRQVSRGAHGAFDGMQFHNVPGQVDVVGNRLWEATHNHCVISTGARASVIHARGNTWTKGHGSVFAGSPAWNSD